MDASADNWLETEGVVAVRELTLLIRRSNNTNGGASKQR